MGFCSQLVMMSLLDCAVVCLRTSLSHIIILHIFCIKEVQRHTTLIALSANEAEQISKVFSGYSLSQSGRTSLREAESIIRK